MKEIDHMLKSVFADKPIAQEPLERMGANIMEQILASPMDFQGKLLAQQRKRWGIIFISSLLVLSLSIFLLSWFFGSWISEGLSFIALWLTANIPFLAWFENRLDWLFDTLILLSNVKLGYQFLWGQYGLAVMGILFSWVLFDGIRDRLNKNAIDGNS